MFVTEQLLDCADIVAAFEKLSGKAVAQGVGGSMFRDSRRPDGFLYGLLDHRLIDVVAALDAGVPVKILAPRRKHELPAPLRVRVGILAGDRVWQFRAPGALGQISFGKAFGNFQMFDQVLLGACGQHRQPVFSSLAAADPNLHPFEIQILYRSVRHSSNRRPDPYNRRRDEAGDAGHAFQNRLDFRFCQDDWQAKFSWRSPCE